MINKENKKEVINELQKDLYSDYIRSKSVYKLLTTNYAKDLAEDEDKLRQELRDVRILAREESEKENKDEEKLKEFAIKINDIDGRINFIVKKKDEVKKAKDNINESADYYNMLNEFDDKNNLIEPKKIT